MANPPPGAVGPAGTHIPAVPQGSSKGTGKAAQGQETSAGPAGAPQEFSQPAAGCFLSRITGPLGPPGVN
jgi:hypothetical protein